MTIRNDVRCVVRALTASARRALANLGPRSAETVPIRAKLESRNGYGATRASKG
jgi:hypothetical protein